MGEEGITTIKCIGLTNYTRYIMPYKNLFLMFPVVLSIIIAIFEYKDYFNLSTGKSMKICLDLNDMYKAMNDSNYIDVLMSSLFIVHFSWCKNSIFVRRLVS